MINQFPYTNFNEVNLDWLAEQDKTQNNAIASLDSRVTALESGGTSTGDELYFCTYGTTTNAEIEAALGNDMLPVCDYGGFRYIFSSRISATQHTFFAGDEVQTREITVSSDIWSASVTDIAPLDSPAFTGTPSAPNPTSGDNSTRIATTHFVQQMAGGNFIAGRGTLANGDDADNIILPGSYNKPAANTVSNLPTQHSGMLYVFSNSNSTVYQIYQGGPYGELFYRQRGYAWKDIKSLFTRMDSVESAITADEASYFKADRRTLTNADDANNITEPGSYYKAGGVSVANIPVTHAGYLYVFSSGSTSYQVFQGGYYEDFYYRYYHNAWVDLGSIPSQITTINGDISNIQDWYFKGNRGTLATGDDADNIYLPGSYAKPLAAVVDHLPTQHSGYLIVLNHTSGGYYQLYLDAYNHVYYRNYLGNWQLVSVSSIYQNRLYGKTIIGLGDSLMYGQGLSAADRDSKTWLARLRDTYDMTAYNYGVSSSAVAYHTGEDPESLATRIDAIVTTHQDETIDYFVIEGGANDYTIESPLGTLERSNVDKSTYYGALNYIINSIKTAWPRCHILLMTNYDRKVRSKTVNGETLTDEVYVNAMVDFAHMRGIPVYDNYHDMGMSIRDWYNSGYLDNWFFPTSLGQHLSVDAYAYLAPIYSNKLQSI